MSELQDRFREAISLAIAELDEADYWLEQLGASDCEEARSAEAARLSVPKARRALVRIKRALRRQKAKEVQE